MKLLTTILMFTLWANTSNAQYNMPFDTVSKKVVFSKVIELDSVFTDTLLFSLAKEWLSVNNANFNRSNADKNYNAGNMFLGIQKGNSNAIEQLHKNEIPLKHIDEHTKKVLGKGVLKYTATSLGCLRLLFIEYDIKIYSKNQRSKVEFTNFTYSHYNQVEMKKVQIYGFNDTEICGSKNTLENLLKCDQCQTELEKFYHFLKNDIKALANDYALFLENHRQSIGKDDW